MTKVSASTLSRQAAKTKNPALAKRLRAQAAKMRREARETKKPRPAEKIIAGLKQAVQHAENRIGAEMNEAMFGDGRTARAVSVDHTPLTEMVNQEQPGRGEIVGGYLAHNADQIAKLARKKGGVDAIQARLRTIELDARRLAMRDSDARVQKVAQQANDQWCDNIVTGFMARCKGMEELDGRGLPDVVVVDGVTLARVIDALLAAGYTASGKKR